MGQSSNAVHVILAVIPIVGIVMGAVVIFFYLLWRHRRITLIIKMGNYSPPQFDLLSFSLLAGLLLSSVGITITAVLAALRTRDLALLGGVIPLSLGAALLAFYGIKRGDKKA
jgi:hypothetical protein